MIGLAVVFTWAQPVGRGVADTITAPIVATAPEDMSEGRTATESGGVPLPAGLKPTPPPLSPEILMERHGFSATDFGYALYDPQTGEWLASYRDEALFIPASVAKVPTSVVALRTLGPNHRFETRFLTAGFVRDGVLYGDLFLVGGGDMTFDEKRLELLIERLIGSGVKSVTGGFYYDDTAFIQGAEIEADQPAYLGYNVGYGGLALNFNRALLKWSPKDGAKIVSALGVDYPDTHAARQATGLESVGNIRQPCFETVLTRPENRNAGDEVVPESWLVPKSWRGSGSIWVPVKNPGAYTASVARTIAASKGLNLKVPHFAPVPSDTKALAVTTGGTTVQIVKGLMWSSNNLTAEILGMASAERLTGRKTGIAESAEFTQTMITGSIPDTTWDGFLLANHSGLTTRSRVSPRQIVAILQDAKQNGVGEKLDYPKLLRCDSWPITSGADPRKPGPTVEVCAKTGTIYYGRGLAGYLETKSGRHLIFGIFTSDYDRRTEFDTANHHEDWSRLNAAKEWLSRARALERDLVQDWVRYN